MSDVYIACEEMDFMWTESQVLRFRQLWKNGTDLLNIAEAFDRDPDEVGLLIISLARQGLIVPRKGGLEIGLKRAKKMQVKPQRKKHIKIDVEKLHRMYVNNVSIEEIASNLQTGERRIYRCINEERGKEPEKWPVRHKNKSETR